MNPLINGTDGRKMSSSWGNTITVFGEPTDMYGKVMSMHDAEIMTYFAMCTRVPMTEIEHMQAELAAGGNPRDIKMKLAHEITRMYHGEEGARAGEAYFIETFQQKQIPDDVLEIDGNYIEEMIAKEVVTSKTELRRLLEAGGVRDAETGEKYSEIPEHVSEPKVLKIGKRRFVKLVP